MLCKHGSKYKNVGKNKNFHDIFLLHKWYKCIFTIPH